MKTFLKNYLFVASGLLLLLPLGASANDLLASLKADLKRAEASTTKGLVLRGKVALDKWYRLPHSPSMEHFHRGEWKIEEWHFHESGVFMQIEGDTPDYVFQSEARSSVTDGIPTTEGFATSREIYFVGAKYGDFQMVPMRGKIRKIVTRRSPEFIQVGNECSMLATQRGFFATIEGMVMRAVGGDAMYTETTTPLSTITRSSAVMNGKPVDRWEFVDTRDGQTMSLMLTYADTTKTRLLAYEVRGGSNSFGLETWMLTGQMDWFQMQSPVGPVWLLASVREENWDLKKGEVVSYTTRTFTDVTMPSREEILPFFKMPYDRYALSPEESAAIKANGGRPID